MAGCVKSTHLSLYNNFAINPIIKRHFHVPGKKTKLMKSDEAFLPSLYLSEGPTENNHTLSLVVVCEDSMGLESLALPLSVTVNNAFFVCLYGYKILDIAGWLFLQWLHLFEFLSNCSYTVSKSEFDIVTMNQYV